MAIPVAVNLTVGTVYERTLLTVLAAHVPSTAHVREFFPPPRVGSPGKNFSVLAAGFVDDEEGSAAPPAGSPSVLTPETGEIILRWSFRIIANRQESAATN